jgi:hypothetical protein
LYYRDKCCSYTERERAVLAWTPSTKNGTDGIAALHSIAEESANLRYRGFVPEADVRMSTELRFHDVARSVALP